VNTTTTTTNNNEDEIEYLPISGTPPANLSIYSSTFVNSGPNLINGALFIDRIGFNTRVPCLMEYSVDWTYGRFGNKRKETSER
jgi:hypothetical protein